MDLRLEANGIHIVCYSPVWTPIRKALEAENPANEPALRSF